MAQPTAENVHTNQIMTDISIAYIQDTSDFIADRVFPVIGVDNKSDKYYTYDQNDWFRDEAEVRAPSTESVGGGYSHSTDSYTCERYAFHKDLDDEVRSNYDDPLNPERDSTEFVTQKLLLKREVLFVSNFLTSSPWTNSYTGGADGTDPNFVYWSDDANSDPEDNVTTWQRAAKKVTGFKPNRLAIGGEVWDDLKRHAQIIEQVKYTREATQVSQTLVAQALGLDELVVAEGIKATNEEGGTESYSQIVGKEGLLYYVPDNPGLLKPSAGYIFGWEGFMDNPYGVRIRDFRIERLTSDRFEGEMYFDLKTVAPDLGIYLDSIVS